jgi:hypothetical protein
MNEALLADVGEITRMTSEVRWRYLCGVPRGQKEVYAAELEEHPFEGKPYQFCSISKQPWMIAAQTSFVIQFVFRIINSY